MSTSPPTPRQEAEDVEAFGACALCGEPIDGEELGLVERFEGHGDLVCQACGEDELAASEEAQDLRRANPLEPDFRRMGE